MPDWGNGCSSSARSCLLPAAFGRPVKAKGLFGAVLAGRFYMAQSTCVGVTPDLEDHIELFERYLVKQGDEIQHLVCSVKIK